VVVTVVVLVALASGNDRGISATAGAADPVVPGGAVEGSALAGTAAPGAGSSAGPGSSADPPGSPGSSGRAAQGPGRPFTFVFPSGAFPAGVPGSGTVASGVRRWSGNLLASRSVDFTGTPGGWSGSNARLSGLLSPTTGPSGALSLLPQSPGPEPVAAASGSPAQGGLVPATPGLLYRATATVRTPGPDEDVQPMVIFYGAGGQSLASVAGQQTRVSSTPTALVPAIGIAPASATGVALAVVAWSTALLGQQTVVEDPSLTDTVDPGAPPVVGPLHVDGNRIVQADGVPVTLRSVQLFGLESSPSLPARAESEIDQAKAWGANTVRVSLGEQYWLPSSCSYSAGYAPALDQVVHWITSLGMVALLDLHFNTILPCTPGAPQMMADYPGSVDFWSSVASRYAADPLVAFDLYNEPHDISDEVWRDGGMVMSGPVPFQAAGMQQMYDAVRGTGAQNLVVVSGNTWGNDLPADRLSGAGIVYGVHIYTCQQGPPPDCATPDPDDPSPILGSWVAPSAAVPVMVSEFGWPSQDDGTFVANVIAFASGHGWSWNAFAFDSIAPFGLLADEPTGGPDEPSASGMPVLAALASGG
jgi:hypothetical protein